jgi:hypothetical protein
MFVSKEFQAVLQALDAGRDNDGLAKVPFKSPPDQPLKSLTLYAALKALSSGSFYSQR